MPKDERQRYIGHSTQTQEEAAYSETEHGPSCRAKVMLKFLKKTQFGVKFPTYAETRELQIEGAKSEQLGRRNSAARRRIEAARTCDAEPRTSETAARTVRHATTACPDVTSTARLTHIRKQL